MAKERAIHSTRSHYTQSHHTRTCVIYPKFKLRYLYKLHKRFADCLPLEAAWRVVYETVIVAMCLISCLDQAWKDDCKDRALTKHAFNLNRAVQ